MNDIATYAELFNSEGRITIIGFGSLVSEASARKSFEFSNFRWGQVKGWARIFNLASCRLIDIGDVRYSTGEIAALSFGMMDNVTSTVALLDITSDGLKSFLTREAGYFISAVPYLDSSGRNGCALVCAEADDDEIVSIWGSDHRPGEWLGGKIFYNTKSVGSETLTRSSVAATESIVECDKMSLIPELLTLEGRREQRDIEIWADMDASQYHLRPHMLPTRQYIYPGPGYTRLCLRAHRKQGMIDEFVNNTYLMDRETTLFEYLNANPILKEYICDEVIYADRICDSMG
jgi:hypothetical protein